MHLSELPLKVFRPAADDASHVRAAGPYLSSLVMYAAMLLTTVGLIAGVCFYGERLLTAVANEPAERSAGPALASIHNMAATLAVTVANGASADSAGVGRPSLATVNTLLQVLIAMAAVIVVGRILGWLFQAVHQPPVIGEVLAGIALGPSLLGRIAPDVSEAILPAATAPFLGIVAQLGVVLYMFLVGLEFDAALLRSRGRAMLAISHASMAVPFVLGALLAVWIYPVLSTSDVQFSVFVLFFGMALSVTAFPVLARILSDRGLTRTELGASALACAASADVVAWCLLSLIVGIAQASVGQALVTIVLTLAYIALMFVIVRPLVRGRIMRAALPLTQPAVAAVFVALLLSACVTELIGVHAIFGAFLLGAVIPHDSAIAVEFRHKLEDVVGVLLLPAFFALAGMRTEIGLVAGWQNWLLCGLIIAVAIVGKLAGTTIAGRATGLSWRTSSILGVLMNTRGLMELIVLNLGLDLGVISPTLYAMMVIMALVTTLLTSPLLHWLGVTPESASTTSARSLEQTSRTEAPAGV